MVHCSDSDLSSYQYLYHLSDVMRQNHAFTAAIVEHILSLKTLPNIVRCLIIVQLNINLSIYFLFGLLWQEKVSRKLILYYGVYLRHGKGLVDAMSAFGVKNPIQRVDIYNYLTQHFFFSIWVFFHKHSLFTGQQGKGEGIFLTPLYHFHQLHRNLHISRVITAESSPLHIASSQTQTGNLWSMSASR